MINNFIAHRGLTEGPNKDIENHPDQIMYAIEAGFDVELDLHVIGGNLYLGHDGPQYKIKEEFINNPSVCELFWVHAKNIEALKWLDAEAEYCHYFWHDKDAYTFTHRRYNSGYIWTYPGMPLFSWSNICVMPELYIPMENWQEDLPDDIYGICSDYVRVIKEYDKLRIARKTIL